MDRRHFLKLSAQLGLGVSLSQLFPEIAFSQSTNLTNKKLLILRANGAWDTLMCMDAYPRELLNSLKLSTFDYLQDDSRQAGERKLKHGFLGNVMSPIFANLNDLCIVNGVLMNIESSTHETNREYMAKGNLTGSTPFFPFALAQGLPSINYKVGYKMEYEPVFDGKYSNQINTMALRSYKEKNEDPLEDFLTDDEAVGTMQKNVILQRRKEQRKIEIMNTLINQAEKEFATNEDGFQQALNALAGLGSNFLGMAQVDFIRDRDLDSHSSNQQVQTRTLTSMFTFLSKLIKFMKATPYLLDPKLGLSLFDVTTVVVTSEFARTAWPEGATGTSHNQFTNSCLLFGGNVKGGNLIGSSYIYKRGEHTAYSHPTLYKASGFDFKTQTHLSKQQSAVLPMDSIGACSNDKCFDYIYPETIWRTVAKEYGIENLSSLPSGPYLRNIFKS